MALSSNYELYIVFNKSIEGSAHFVHYIDLKDLQIEICEDNYRTKSFENALNKKSDDFSHRFRWFR